MAIDITAWYEKYGPMIIRRCRRILKNEQDALDAAQDVFINLLKAQSNLHGQFPSSLLYTMATNICLNRLRKNKWESYKELSNESDEKSNNDDVNRIEAQILLDSILKDESEMNRSICFMYHVDGMTLKEIGEIVNLSIAGVRKRLEAFKSRARLKMEVV